MLLYEGCSLIVIMGLYRACGSKVLDTADILCICYNSLYVCEPELFILMRPLISIGPYYKACLSFDYKLTLF